MIHSLRTLSDSHGAKVSKEELLRYVESQFNVADINHDGYLDVYDLTPFFGLLSHPTLEKTDS
jgi:hypothetical protein